MYNRSATRDPDCMHHFRQLVREIPRPLYNVEHSSHGWLLEERVRGAAVIAFGPPPARVPKQPYVDADAMQLIGEQRVALSRAHFAGRLIKWSAAKATFSAWAFRKKVLKRRSTLEFIQPWVLQLRVRSVMRARVLQREAASHLNACYKDVAAAVAKGWTDDVNGVDSDDDSDDDDDDTVADGDGVPARAPAPVLQQHRLKRKHTAIKALSTVPNSSHAFLKDKDDVPTLSQGAEGEAVAEYGNVCV